MVSRLDAATGTGLSEVWWDTRSTQPQNRKGRTLYQDLVTLPIAGGNVTRLQIGLAAVLQIEDGRRPQSAGPVMTSSFRQVLTGGQASVGIS